MDDRQEFYPQFLCEVCRKMLYHLPLTIGSLDRPSEEDRVRDQQQGLPFFGFSCSLSFLISFLWY